MDWFRHDTGARNDIKVKKLARTAGIAGIGVFWVVVEILFEHGGVCPVEEINDELEYLGGEDLLDQLVKVGLVDIKDGTVTSHRVREEISYQEESRKKLSEAGRIAANARWKRHNANACERIQPHANECDSMRSDAFHATLPNPTIKKDISPTKVGSIQKEAKFTPPSLQEIADYCKERKNNVDPQKVYDYYSSGDWKDQSGKPVRNWKQKIIAVWEKDGKGYGTVASGPAKHRDYSDVRPEDLDKEWSWNV